MKTLQLAPQALPILAVAVAVLLLPEFWKAIVLLSVALLPFNFGDLGPYKTILVSEWLPLILLPATLIGIVKSKRRLILSEGRIIVAALLLFGLVASINAIRFSDLAQNYLRSSWQIACGFMFFLEMAWYGQWLPRNAQRLKRGLWVLVMLAFIASAARVANYYSGTPLPLLAKTFDYAGQTAISGGGLADRIGGLAEAATMGICALGALAQLRAVGIWGLLLAGWFAAMVIVAGGRSFLVAVIVAVFIYVLVSTGRRRLQAVTAVLAFAAVVVAALSTSGVSRQLARLTAFSGGLGVQDPYRYEGIQAQIEQAKLHPLFGKGLGVLPKGGYSDFASEMLRFGGHGSYTSILANYGVAGGLFLAMMLLVPIIGAWRLLGSLRRRSRSSPLIALSFFILLGGIIRVVMDLLGGTGHSDMGLYANAGLFAACLCAARLGGRELA